MATQTIDLPRERLFAGNPAAHAYRNALIFIGALTLLRFATAAWLPLSFDEAYFWLWSKNLAVSYYDHPPMIALAIRLGTILFGNTQFGVRAVPCILSVLATCAVWRAAAILLASERAGATAACLFNATLMVASQAMAAIPDALVLFASAAVLLGVAKLEETGDERWWLAIGAALGFAILSKYTAFFLAGGVALWHLRARQRRILPRHPWPWLALLIFALCLAPNLIWNAAHDWESFRFQFGRVVAGAPTFRYMLEFAGSQLALASPFILAPAGIGFLRDARRFRTISALSIATSLVAPALAYFLVHAVHSRVQGNWPSFIYPGLAILAAAVLEDAHSDRGSAMISLSRVLALPCAAIILLVSYAQAWTGVLPLGYADPIARMTAVGFDSVASDISAVAARHESPAILTANYVVTGWLGFYLEPHRPVIQITDRDRWLQAPAAADNLLRGELLFVTQHPAQELPFVSRLFRSVAFDSVFVRSRNGVAIDRFYVYRLSGQQTALHGRIANAPLS